MLGPMSVDRRRPVAAVLALLGALLVVAAVIGTAVHYAAQPDAAVGTPPGSSAWDRMQAGAQREGSDLLDRAAGREPEARVVEAPMPERTYGPEAPTRSISVGCSPSRAVDGALVLPEAPGTVWYDQSAQIGAPGASLIAGLETGAPVLVTDDEGEVREYVVESLQVYEQQALPEDMLQSTGPDELVLVTCSGASISTGGAWSYEYNLVVTAPTV